MDAFGEGGEAFFVDVADGDLGTRGEKLFGKVLSEPGGAAGDDDFELVELHRGASYSLGRQPRKPVTTRTYRRTKRQRLA